VKIALLLAIAAPVFAMSVFVTGIAVVAWL
jgi:hypothetical protein